jgi:DNA-binding LytR/AlgR family response regulator
MTNCIIVDDEELARALLETYVKKVGQLELKASFENPLEALAYLKKNNVDLVFLDIQMPDLKGTDLAELLQKTNTQVIFTTAYSEYALQGFELSALDYLLKPITFKRFLTAVEKLPAQTDVTNGKLTLKSGYDLHKISYDEIIYIESDSEYVNYHLVGGKKVMVYQSLGKLIESLPNTFMRVHRSYIIHKEKVTGLKGRDLVLFDKTIPVSDSYFERVKKELFDG